MKNKIFKMLLLAAIFSFSYVAKATTNVVINNNSSCNVTLNMWDATNTFPSDLHIFSCGFISSGGGTQTYTCLPDITHVEFNYKSGNGFNVSIATSPGSSSFSGSGCLNGVSYSWTYQSNASTCGGLPNNLLTITLI